MMEKVSWQLSARGNISTHGVGEVQESWWTVLPVIRLAGVCRVDLIMRRAHSAGQAMVSGRRRERLGNLIDNAVI